MNMIRNASFIVEDESVAVRTLFARQPTKSPVPERLRGIEALREQMAEGRRFGFRFNVDKSPLRREQIANLD